jgi:hypothetical protein
MRFYFHVSKGNDHFPDREGAEAADLMAAQLNALQAIQELQAEEAPLWDDWAEWQISIADGSGQVLCVITVEEAPGDRPGINRTMLQ